MLQSYEFLTFLVFCLTLLAVIAMTGPKGRDEVAKDALTLLGKLFTQPPKRRQP